MHYKLFTLIIVIFLTSCSSERNEDKLQEYKEVGHLTKNLDELDVAIYTQYTKERVALETKYLTIANNQQLRKSEYQKIKDSFASDFRNHIDYANKRVPELNVAIDKIEDEIRIIKSNRDEYIQDLISVNSDPSQNNFVNDLEKQIESLEKTVVDLMSKRVDLFLQYRKFELSKEDPSVQKELNAIIREAELATNKASKSLQ